MTATLEVAVKRCSQEGCGVPSTLVLEDPDGVHAPACFNHAPWLEEERELARSKGGVRTAGKIRRHQYLDADELGRLESPADALRIAAAVTFAVATGRLSSSAGSVVLRALQEWRQAHEAVDVLAEVRRMKALVDAMRKERGR
jgi:hypothetical protein